MTPQNGKRRYEFTQQHYDRTVTETASGDGHGRLRDRKPRERVKILKNIYLCPYSEKSTVSNTANKNIFPTWAELAVVFGGFFAAQFVFTFVAMLFTKNPAQGGAVFFIYSATMLATIALAIFLRSRHPVAYKAPGRKPMPNPVLVLWGLVAMIATSVVVEPVIDLFPERWMEGVDAMMSQGTWAMLSAVVAAPVFEEWLLRGIVQKGMVAKWGPVGGIAGASVVFGLIHIVPQQVVNAMMIGLVLGYVYYVSGSLAAVVFLHAVNNGLSYVLYQVYGQAATSLRLVVQSDGAYNTIYAISSVIVIISLYMLLRLRKVNPAAEAEGGAAELPNSSR